MRIRLSPSVSSSFIPAWQYLSQYPYGSTDATAGVLLGDTVLAKYWKDTQPGAPAPQPAQSPPTPNNGRVEPEAGVRKAQIADEIQRSLLRLARYQRDDGGWGWFETGNSDLWMTADATWSILLARDAGYAINETVLDGGLKATASLAQDWRNKPRTDYEDPGSIALAAWALAEGGVTDDARVNLQFLEQQWTKHPNTICHADMAVAVLAAHKIGDTYAPKVTFWMNELWSHRLRLGALSAWQCAPHHPSEGAMQEPPDVDATVLLLLAAETINPTDPRIDSVARWVIANRDGDHWVSPRTTAATLMALGAYMDRSRERQPDFTAKVTIDGKLVLTRHFGPESLDQPDTVIEVPGAGLSEPLSPTPSPVQGKGRTRGVGSGIHLVKTGPGRLYYSLDLRESMPVSTPAAPMSVWRRWSDRVWHPERLQVPFASSGYKIKRVFLRNTSRRNFFWEDSVPDPARDFNADDDIIVRLIIDSARAGSHLVIEEPVPAGCTISEVSGDSTEYWNNWWDYTDVRDDRIVFFIGDLPRGRHEIDYHLRAASTGVYDVMPTSITGVFDPSLHALGSADRITVAGK